MMVTWVVVLSDWHRRADLGDQFTPDSSEKVLVRPAIMLIAKFGQWFRDRVGEG